MEEIEMEEIEMEDIEIGNKNRCIICLEEEIEKNKLIKNARCLCVYYYCEICKRQVENMNRCPLCRINIVININEEENITYNETMRTILTFMYIMTGMIINMIYIYFMITNKNELDRYKNKYEVDREIIENRTRINIEDNIRKAMSVNYVMNISMMIGMLINIIRYVKINDRVCRNFIIYKVIGLMEMIYGISYNKVIMESDREYKSKYFTGGYEYNYLERNNIIRRGEYDMYGLEEKINMIYKILIIVMITSIINGIKIGYKERIRRSIKRVMIYIVSIYIMMYSVIEIISINI
jgi:hypothetical protein